MPAGTAEMEKSERIVGELQALKVFKVSTSGRLADLRTQRPGARRNVIVSWTVQLLLYL
jgi:hypothetical protein